MKQKLVGIYFILFSIIIYVMYFTKYLQSFLARKVLGFTLIAALLLLVLGILILIGKIKNLNIKKNSYILIIPIIMLIIAGDGTVSLNLAKKRGSNLSAVKANKTNNPVGYNTR